MHVPKKYAESIQVHHHEFIARQHMFFVATAAQEGRVNLAPKDADSLHVLGPNRVLWMNLTGSENETAAHLLQTSRMTLMWCSFDRKPMILRLYGQAVAIHRHDEEWEELSAMFKPSVGARQVIDMSVDLVLSSCGFGVPIYEFVSQRDTLDRWHRQQGAEGLATHWAENNVLSLDGAPTGLFGSVNAASNGSQGKGASDHHTFDRAVVRR